MISKKLTIAAAFVLLTGLSVGPAQAQATAPAPTAPAAAAPAAAGPTVIKAAAATAGNKNPYGLGHIIEQRNPVSMTILIILAIMSVGTWYIFFTKYLDQSRILGIPRSLGLVWRIRRRGDRKRGPQCRRLRRPPPTS